MVVREILRGTRQHITDSAGLFVVSTPFGAFLENVLAGMTDEISFNSRLIVGGLYLAGLGGAIGFGRNISQKVFHITDETKERYQHLHDMLYVSGVTALVNPFIYAAAGARDMGEIATATGWAMVAGLFMGGVMGYSVDLMRDLTGYKQSYRVPKRINNMPSFAKKTLAVGILTASVGAAGLIYHLTPDKSEDVSKPPSQIEVIEQYVR